jgi:hypothetical protein
MLRQSCRGFERGGHDRNFKNCADTWPIPSRTSSPIRESGEAAGLTAEILVGQTRTIDLDQDQPGRQARGRWQGNTTIIGRAGERTQIDGRIEQIRREIGETTSDYEKEKLHERLAKLAGGVAVIRVGTPSESEMKSKKKGLDDAIGATKTAVAEGIVPCSGLDLLRCLDAVAQESQIRRRRENGCADYKAGGRSAHSSNRRELRSWRWGWRSPPCWKEKAITALTPRARSMSTWWRLAYRSDQGGADRTGKRRFGGGRSAADGCDHDGNHRGKGS